MEMQGSSDGASRFAVSLFLTFTYFMCVRMHIHTSTPWRSENNSWESVLAFYHVGLGIKFMSSALMASILTHWANLLVTLQTTQYSRSQQCGITHHSISVQCGFQVYSIGPAERKLKCIWKQDNNLEILSGYNCPLVLLWLPFWKTFIYVTP